jgi:hypothetical protein
MKLHRRFNGAQASKYPMTRLMGLSLGEHLGRVTLSALQNSSVYPQKPGSLQQTFKGHLPPSLNLDDDHPGLH